ncbi:MAG TPA: DUF5658 family protein [Kofleriaceae bacterium]|nr:DUF5658 family protein [Kofleriaceae bacterium]
MNRSALLGIPHRTLYALVCVAMLCNLVDALMTVAGVSSGTAVEGNPLMAAPLAVHPVAFVAAKIALVSLGLLVLWNHRRRPAAVAGIVGSCGIYVLVVLYQLQGLLGV